MRNYGAGQKKTIPIDGKRIKINHGKSVKAFRISQVILIDATDYGNDLKRLQDGFHRFTQGFISDILLTEVIYSSDLRAETELF